MDRFEKEKIPLTVATIDMDWHWVDLKKQFKINANGWTGYSWNTELFKDYKSFLNNLQNRNLKVTLNLHPADGIRHFEDMYNDVAKAVGIDPETKEDVKFSCKSDDFWNAYFDKVHKPYEKDGVDFWWIDWQQGKKSDIEGLDPLLALNHYHFLDNAENGKLPLILSRYAGLGSHRYPLGFSGDTAINYKVLDFQPYFTANAANAAYFWWSHDIGGHHFGYKDDELYLRWIEFGVFSPILRLHSTSNDLLGKEPWKYRRDVAHQQHDYRGQYPLGAVLCGGIHGHPLLLPVQDRIAREVTIQCPLRKEGQLEEILRDLCRPSVAVPGLLKERAWPFGGKPLHDHEP